MSSTPGFCNRPVAGAARLTTADTSRTAPSGGGAAIFSPGAAGGMCERINIVPVATTTATVVRIFRYDGTTAHPLLDISIPVITAAVGIAISDIVLSAVTMPDRFPIAVPASGGTPWTLTATIDNTQTGVDVNAEGGGL